MAWEPKGKDLRWEHWGFSGNCYCRAPKGQWLLADPEWIVLNYTYMDFVVVQWHNSSKQKMVLSSPAAQSVKCVTGKSIFHSRGVSTQTVKGRQIYLRKCFCVLCLCLYFSLFIHIGQSWRRALAMGTFDWIHTHSVLDHMKYRSK